MMICSFFVLSVFHSEPAVAWLSEHITAAPLLQSWAMISVIGRHLLQET